jgi:hypothetical protein
MNIKKNLLFTDLNETPFPGIHVEAIHSLTINSIVNTLQRKQILYILIFLQ